MTLRRFIWIFTAIALGAFALAVGWYIAVRGDRSWPARVGFGTGAIVAAVWLFYLIGRFVV